MTNDAKLGLLTGVLGVVVAAVAFGGRGPAPAGNPDPPRRETPAAKAELVTATEPRPVPDADLSPTAAEVVVAPAPSELPRELPSTPVVRARREPDATPTGRTNK